MVTIGKPLIRQRGVTYFWALLLIFLVTLGFGKLLEDMRMANVRGREDDLLYTGNLYRSAIRQYALSTPVGGKRYPEKLDDLLRDPRYPVVRRYLRRLYPDPMTGASFGVVPSPEGGIMGVRSESGKGPVKRAGFQQEQTGFAEARSYRDWEFTFAP